MRAHSRSGALLLLTFLMTVVLGAGSAQAVVVDAGSIGQTSVSYNAANLNKYVGVSLVPGTSGTLLAKTKVPYVTTPSTSPCGDPWLASDLGPLPSTGLCWHSGPVMHRNETFALTWDPDRWYWQTTRNYLEQFLRDVADGTGTLTSPFAVTPQYADGVSDPANPADPQNPTGPNPRGQARNASLFGGACVDYGVNGGSTCKFGNTSGSDQGHDYPNGQAGDCSGATPAAPCLTDQAIRQEVSNMFVETQLGQHQQPEYTPLIVVLTPKGVVDCLDSAKSLCSVGSGSAAEFCSYHSAVTLPDGTKVSYVVQPWTAGTKCDEPKLPNPANPDISIDAAIRIVNPLSQGEISAIVNPLMNGWFAPTTGGETQDNQGCGPGGYPADKVTVGASSQNPYYLQGAFSNAGVLVSDPNAPSCAIHAAFAATFVGPSSVNQGDEVQFDGSTTVTSLLVPKGDPNDRAKGGYFWDFGDHVSAVGPSVVHTYAKGGTYQVTLTAIDRGGDTSVYSQTVVVLGPDGKPVTPPPAPGVNPGLHAKIQLMPQGLRSVLNRGVLVNLVSNQAADGIAVLSISRSDARRAHIRAGRGSSVVIGRGTISGIKSGAMSLHVRLPRSIVAKLKHLRHVTITIRLSLIGAARDHLTIDAAGRY